jgi:hypothetical protein
MAKTIFLQEDSDFNNVNERVNIILSSELYWCKIFEIPIDSKKEVELVLPGFFEDYFDVSNYKFHSLKLSKHKYLCFAYDENFIVQTIKNAKLEFKKISNIYFAHNELIDNFEDEIFYNIDDKIYVKQNNIIVQIPKTLVSNQQIIDFDIDNISLSKHKIYINQSSKYIDAKTSIVLSVLFVLFALINFSKTIYLNNELKQYDNKIAILKQKYNLPASMIQTKAIINEFKNNETQYLKLLQATKYLLDYKNSIDTKLLSFDYKNSKVLLKLEDKNQNQLKKYIKTKYKILSFTKGKNSLNIGIKI